MLSIGVMKSVGGCGSPLWTKCTVTISDVSATLVVHGGWTCLPVWCHQVWFWQHFWWWSQMGICKNISKFAQVFLILLYISMFISDVFGLKWCPQVYFCFYSCFFSLSIRQSLKKVNEPKRRLQSLMSHSWQVLTSYFSKNVSKSIQIFVPPLYYYTQMI